ncbi:MAG: DUF1266 domain-containing protein [Bacteroidia bacterium]|nr:DUF1266 domain-containing protein [Bacteroidia bacterium]
MENLSPFWPAGLGLLMLIIGYRAVRKKRILGSSGEVRGATDPRFYLRVGGFWLAGLFMMVFAAMSFHRQYGWVSLTVYVLLLCLLFWLMLRFSLVRKGIGKATVSLFNRKKKEKRSIDQEPDQGDISTPQLWALAAAALPGAMRGLDSASLAGRSLSSSNERRAQKWLKNEWEVDDAEELEEVQDWLIETGHRTEFFDEIQRFRLFTEEYTAGFIHRLETGQEEAQTPDEIEEMKGRLRLVAEKGQSLTDVGFLAWDYLRYLDNCRAGYLAGFLEEDEAWDAMLGASQVLQSRYDSWEECGEAFLMAREYWSTVETEKDGVMWRKAFLQLRESPQSPWREIDWALPLYKR